MAAQQPAAVPALERTGQRIVAGTWGCAAITMAASAANAALTYGALGDNRALGLATGVAVDIGLCVALIGDRRLYTHGLSSNWGRALRITTAIMSLILNVGISLRDGHYFAALLHSFLPVLLIVLCEYGQDVLLQLTALRRRLEAEQTPVTPVTPVALDLPAATYQRVVPPSTWVVPRPAVPPQWPGDASAPSEPWSAETPKSTEPRATIPRPQPAAPRSRPQRGSHVVVPIAKPARHTPSRVSKPKPAGPDPTVVTQVRALIGEVEAAGGQIGRREIARRLGVSDWIARQALEHIRGDNKSTASAAGTKGRKASGVGR